MTKEFINSLKKVAPSLGMNLGNPKVITLPDNRPASYIQVILLSTVVLLRLRLVYRGILVQKLDEVIKMSPAIIMVVIPNNKGDHYAAVKKVGRSLIFMHDFKVQCFYIDLFRNA